MEKIFSDPVPNSFGFLIWIILVSKQEIMSKKEYCSYLVLQLPIPKNQSLQIHRGHKSQLFQIGSKSQANKQTKYIFSSIANHPNQQNLLKLDQACFDGNVNIMVTLLGYIW